MAPGLWLPLPQQPPVPFPQNEKKRTRRRTRLLPLTVLKEPDPRGMFVPSASLQNVSRLKSMVGRPGFGEAGEGCGGAGGRAHGGREVRHGPAWHGWQGGAKGEQSQPCC